jgi:hypothetical protein
MSANISLPTRLKLIMARRPQTDEETEATVEDLELIIRELETLQMWLYKQQRRRNSLLASQAEQS